MTCQPCADAESHPRSAEFAPGCLSCQGRAVAAVGSYDESKAAGKLTDDFKRVLREVFGESTKDGYAQVKQWAGKMAQADAKGLTT
jgi:hypothetical protein